MQERWRLGGLLGNGSSVDVASYLGRAVELSDSSFDAVPGLARHRGSALSSNEVVDAGLELCERVLDVLAVGEAGTKENGVEG